MSSIWIIRYDFTHNAFLDIYHYQVTLVLLTTIATSDESAAEAYFDSELTAASTFLVSGKLDSIRRRGGVGQKKT